MHYGKSPILAPALSFALTCMGSAAQDSGTDAPPTQPGEVVCPRAAGPLTIDGKLDEPAWAEAPQVGPLLTLGARNKPDHDLTYVKVLRDEAALYLAITCNAPPGEVAKRRARDNGNVWRADHVEIFVSPLPESEDYFRLVVDRGGSLLDAWHTKARSSPTALGSRSATSRCGTTRITTAATSPP